MQRVRREHLGTRWLGRALVMGAVVAGMVGLLGGSALAARPVKGGRYSDHSEGMVLQLDAAGRSAVSRLGTFGEHDPASAISPIDLPLKCPGEPVGFPGGALLPLGRPATAPVRVSSGGKISGTVQLANVQLVVGSFPLAIRGRFITSRLAVVTYSGRPNVQEGADPAPKSCTIHLTARLHLRPTPPFRGCRSHDGRTIIANSKGRIWKQWATDDDGARIGAFYGCLFATNRRVLISWSDFPNGYRHPHAFRLAGPYVAYVYTEIAALTELSSVAVVDLRTNRVVHYYSDHVQIATASAVTAFVLNNRGAIGWIANVYGQAQVLAADSTGEHLLDSGKGIDLTYLTLKGSTLKWRNHGVTKTATLT